MDRFDIDLRKKPTLSKSELVAIIDSPKFVDRMLHATRNGDPWLKFVTNHRGTAGKRTRVTTGSAQTALRRLMAGEEPPLMPSERKGRFRTTGKRPVEISISEKIAEQLIKIANVMPHEVSRVVVNPGTKGVSIEFSDGRFAVLKQLRRAPGKRMSFRMVTFISPSPTVDPLDLSRPTGDPDS